MAVRHVGGDNDGYLDNILLITRSMSSILIWLILAAGVLLVGGIVFYVVRKRRNG